MGTPVVATVPGKLTLVAHTSYSGYKVTIIDKNGWYHFYAHLQKFGPGIGPSSNGKQVKAGQVIGYVGKSGTSSNGVIHLHYSIYPNGNYNAGINPWPYLKAAEKNVCNLPPVRSLAEDVVTPDMDREHDLVGIESPPEEGAEAETP